LALLQNTRIGLFRLGFLVAAVLYNWTEAGFKTITPVFFMFFIIAMDYPRAQLALESEHPEYSGDGDESKLLNARHHREMPA
jgi:hypothetical protein